MKYYEPTFKIETIISAENKEEAIEKSKMLEPEIEELSNFAVWKIKLKDGSIQVVDKTEFWGDHKVEIGMIHEFNEIIDYDILEIVERHSGKVIEIQQALNYFYFICEQI